MHTVCVCVVCVCVLAYWVVQHLCWLGSKNHTIQRERWEGEGGGGGEVVCVTVALIHPLLTSCGMKKDFLKSSSTIY